MKNILFIACVVIALMCFTPSPALAQLTWGTGGSGGSGTWDSSTPNWFTGSTNIMWLPGLSGTFAGTSGTVTISGTQEANQLTFSNIPGTYTLTGGTVEGVASFPTGLTIETDSDAIINSNINMVGSSALTKTGTGTLLLSGTNTLTSMDITEGTIAFNTTGNTVTPSLGQGTIYLGEAGTSSGTLAFSPSLSSSINLVKTNTNIMVQGNGNDTITVTGTAPQANQLTITGTVTVNDTTLNVTGGNVVFSGPILGTTANSKLNVAGIAILTNTGNTIKSISVTNAGFPNGSFLALNASNALPSDVAVTLSGTSSGLEVGFSNSISQTIGSVTGNGEIINVSNTGTSSLTINNSSADTFDGNIGSGTTGPGSFNSLSLTKTGTGVLTLTGTNNTYTGGTTVMSGTLIVSKTSGSATGSGTVTVSSGATLGGSGKIISPNIAINGNVQVGIGGTDTTSILMMTIPMGSISLSNANLVFNLNSATPGQSNELVIGNTTPSVLFSTSTLTLNLRGGSTIADGTQYTLLTSSSGGLGVGFSIFGGDLSLSGSDIISGLNLDITTPGYANSYLKLVADGSGYDIDVITGVSAVPEPGTWALLLGGLVFLFAYARRRRLVAVAVPDDGCFFSGNIRR